MCEEFAREITEEIALAGLETFKFHPDSTNTQAINYLADAYSKRRLTLVVGAGVSTGSGLLPWEQLVTASAKAALKDTGLQDFPDVLKREDVGPLTTVRFLETSLGIRTAFRSMLFRELYANFDPARENKTLHAVCLAALGRERTSFVREIITYNFDDLLEAGLRNSIRERGLDRDVSPVFSDATYRESIGDNCIKVYHVHGYLPYNQEWTKVYDSPVVFSERDYHTHYFNPAFWANEVQMRLFSTSCCLFVGMSMSDPNVRRLLDHTHSNNCLPRHYCFVRTNTEAVESTDAKCIAYVQQKDLESLGVNPVWITGFEQIPVILKNIIGL